MMTRIVVCAWVAGAALFWSGCSDKEAPDPTPSTGRQEPETQLADTSDPPERICADRNPARNVYFGDLHIHTALSFDAWAYEIRATPADSYRFAQGEPMRIAPLDDNGRGMREVTLARPLDFAAVTDHAEYLAEVQACVTPGSPAYDTDLCVQYRVGGSDGYVYFGFLLSNRNPQRIPALCGPKGVDCPGNAAGIWADIVQAANDATDTSDACQFTAFPAYEYTAATDVSNLHRNVIFRNDRVPASPTTYFEEPTAQGLWAALRRDCLEAGTGCDVLAIPHNANLSNGNMFIPVYPEAADLDAERQQALDRGAIEPLVEIFQHKGDSECRNGFAAVLGEPDELCNFEKVIAEERFTDCGETVGQGAMAGLGCTHRLDFVRNVLKEGLSEAERLGANPYRLGFVAATDTHAGLSGAVTESGYVGHLGTADDEPEEALKPGDLTPGGIVENPGGLTAVWAEENTRDALFDALRRRETYATSGPRITVRFFGAWSLPADLCQDPAMVEKADAAGVPMGAILAPPNGDAAAPMFVVQALRDAAEKASPLQRIQMIKGWVDETGATREQVFEIAGDPDNGASVDPTTCERSGAGEDLLCSVWTDPTYISGQRAFYYARVVENPSCRWSAFLCNQLSAEDRPATCDEPDRPRTIQERAWTSPIWIEP